MLHSNHTPAQYLNFSLPMRSIIVHHPVRDQEMRRLNKSLMIQYFRSAE